MYSVQYGSRITSRVILVNKLSQEKFIKEADFIPRSVHLEVYIWPIRRGLITKMLNFALIKLIISLIIIIIYKRRVGEFFKGILAANICICIDLFCIGLT